MNFKTLPILCICLVANFNVATGQTLESEAPVEPTVANEGSQKSGMAGVGVKVLRADQLMAKHGGKAAKVSMIEVTFDPLAASMPHRHPGPVSGYVLEGTLEFQIGDQPLQTLRAGDTFFERSMILHRVARNPDKQRKCRILVTMVHPADAERLTIPEMKKNARTAAPQKKAGQ